MPLVLEHSAGLGPLQGVTTQWSVPGKLPLHPDAPLPQPTKLGLRVEFPPSSQPPHLPGLLRPVLTGLSASRLPVHFSLCWLPQQTVRHSNPTSARPAQSPPTLPQCPRGQVHGISPKADLSLQRPPSCSPVSSGSPSSSGLSELQIICCFSGISMGQDSPPAPRALRGQNQTRQPQLASQPVPWSSQPVHIQVGLPAPAGLTPWTPAPLSPSPAPQLLPFSPPP